MDATDSDTLLEAEPFCWTIRCRDNFDLDNPVTGLKENVTKLYQEMQTILFDQINTTVSNAHNNYLMGRLLLKLRSTERTAMFQTL
jgi:hypothetical protein